MSEQKNYEVKAYEVKPVETKVNYEVKAYEVKPVETKVNHEPEPAGYVIDAYGCVVSMKSYMENRRAYAYCD